MSINSINTNVAALRAQENIGAANRASSSSIARLSSGERIVRAADDVASMSAGTSLRTNVTTLRTALINASQGGSMLQVADGALNQITDILLRQKAIAVQAGSGSLSASERSFLNQEFQNLTAEIDRIAGQTNFNGVNLLDGSVLSSSTIETKDSTADKAVLRIQLTAALADGNVITINGMDITAEATDPIDPQGLRFRGGGASAAADTATLLDYLQNNKLAPIAAFEYTLEGTTTIVATARAGGAQGNRLNVEEALAGVTLVGASGGGNIVLAQGGRDNGVSEGSVTAVGTIGDSVIFRHEQVAARATISFTSGAVIPAGAATVTIGGVTVTEGTDFDRVLKDDGTTLDVEATLDEIVAAFNRDTSNDYQLSQSLVYRDGLDIIVQKRTIGDVFTADFATAATATATGGGITGATVQSATLNNGEKTGVHLDGITNKDFIGTIKGFQVTYEAEDQVGISIVVGGRTYTATGVNVAINNITDLDNDLAGGAETFIADTTPAVRLRSAEGDYFDIDLMGARENLNVSNQDDANDLAGRLDAALNTLTVYQDRVINNFTPIGGSSATIRLSNFDDFVIGNVTVSKASSEESNAVIEFTAGGEVFRSEGLRDDVRAGTVLKFVSTTNTEHVITYRHGQSDFALNTEAGAQSFEEFLRTAFRVGADGAGASFQVGTSTSDTLKISIGVATTTELYGGASINVLTQEAAATAGDVIDAAIDSVTSIRATVGALQSRFDFASANIESSLQNQDAARGVLLDTDIAAESTAFATAQVQLQAGISVLAQANLLSQNLLKLIG